MAARRPFWQWHRWKSIGFCLWPPPTCIWNLKLKFQSKLDLCSGNHAVYRQTDGWTDRRTDGRTRWIQYTPPPTSLGGGIMIAIFLTTFLNAFSWMQIYEFRLNFTEVCLQGSNWQYIPALVQINGLAPASNKPLSFCTLCLDQSVHLRNRTVTSLDMWILHWRRSHWCLKSLVTQLDCLFNRWPIGDRWVPLTKSQ